jgi:hypothetical protein
MKHTGIKLVLFVTFMFSMHTIFAQDAVDNSMENCANLLSPEYVSTGQEFFADLNKNNKATFHTTFYGGSRYRLVACSNIKQHKLILNVYDTEMNLLFSNIEHDYTPYWNLGFTSTVDCIIEIEVESKKQVNKPVKLLIGFKEKARHIN